VGPKRDDMDRRSFLKAGAGTAAGLAVLGAGGVAHAEEARERINGMPARTLPRASRTLPILGLGTATMMPGSPIPDGEKVRLIRYAYDRGIRYFDTASLYRTEPFVGQALEDVRDQVEIATKVWPESAESTRKQVEASLASLRTDVIDCVKIHLAHNLEVSLKVLDELEKLKAEGKIRRVGMSNHIFFEVAHKLIDTGRLDEFLCARSYFPKGETSIISPYNAELREMCIARAHELGMNVIGMKVMGGFMYGSMHDLWVPDYDPARAAKLPAAAIRWCFSDPRFHLYLIGVSRSDEIDANIRTVSGDLTLTDDDRMVLAEFSAKVWEGETVKLCPRMFAHPGSTDTPEQLWQEREKLLGKVVEHLRATYKQG
jgi:aryl-alcohol dehydrogenase-like predicted oxidoreductase